MLYADHLPTKAPAATPPQPQQKPKSKPVAPPARPRVATASLVAFSSCEQLVRELRKEGLAEVGPYGLMGQMPVAMAMGAPVGSAASPRAEAAPTAYSRTNNQEEGVDEPDLVKTDGRVMVLVPPGLSAVHVMDVSGKEPVLLGTLAIPQADNLRLLLMGDTVIGVGQTYGTDGRSRTVARVISISDPRHPTVARTFTVEGALLDARMLRGRVLLVTQSQPALPFASPADGTAGAAAKALRTNRKMVSRATVQQLVPGVGVTPENRRYRSSCSQTMRPGVRSGLGTTTVVTIDPAQAAPTQNLTVMGSGSVLYASTDALYLATTSWQSQQLVWSGRGSALETNLHGFDVSSADQVRYLGTGSVKGSLTGQYSLSEHKGFLRVATTIGPSLAGDGRPGLRVSDNRVTVLKPVNGALLQVGLVAGLGRDERIYGVRFLGDVGYVVTFKVVDPLYVIDLADPRHPKVRGELKVTGYSSALYPLGGGQLLGIGQAVDDKQRTTGAQVSVFDVSDQTRPALSSKVVHRGGWSAAQYDQHSLLWWEPSRMLVMPLTTSSDDGAEWFAGSVVYEVTTAGDLREVARVEPPAAEDGQCCGSGVLRSLVIGELLYSVTERGLLSAPMDRLDDQAWLPYSS